MVTWRKRLEGLETADGRPFPPQLMREIVRSFERLELANHMTKALAEERDEALAAETEQFPEHEKAVLLEGLRGVGQHSAMLLSAEVFGREFKNRRHLSSYLGLTPSPYSSGDVERSRSISKAGNRPGREPSGSIWPGAGCGINHKVPSRAGSENTPPSARA